MSKRLNLHQEHKFKLDETPTYPAWHFNFRDKSKLPDVHDIRRASQIRMIAVGVAALLLAYLGYVEFTALTWRMKLSSLKSDVVAETPANQKLLDLNKTFIESKQIAESLNNFYSPSIDPIDLLIKISKLRPKNLVFNNIVMREDEQLLKGGLARDYYVTLNGFVKGRDKAGISSMEAFESALSEDAFFKKNMDEFKVDSLERDADLGMLNFIIKIKIKGSYDRG